MQIRCSFCSTFHTESTTYNRNLWRHHAIKHSTICTKKYDTSKFLSAAAQFSKMSSKATLDRYKSILDSLMSFLHQNDEKYGKEKVYSQEELNRILPDDVVRWMKLRSFGTPDPELDADPKLARSNTLQFYKKAISFFIPNRLISWNTTRMEGNPTKSLEVNAFIKMVKKKR
jgi:hypothetical protein